MKTMQVLLKIQNQDTSSNDGSLSATACNKGVCYGHALSESNNWYGDMAVFVDSSCPWFVRGGDYDTGAEAGLFDFLRGWGSAYSRGSFRIVLAAV